jgi:hypothetical protein
MKDCRIHALNALCLAEGSHSGLQINVHWYTVIVCGLVHGYGKVKMVAIQVFVMLFFRKILHWLFWKIQCLILYFESDLQYCIM